MQATIGRAQVARVAGARRAAGLLMFCLALAAGSAQARIATPDLSICARLVWTAMVEIDSANRTGNYSVLRALGSRSFQAANDEARLAAIFKPLRDRYVDLGRAILLEPTYYIPPSVDAAGQLRLRGGFESRPSSLRFDFIFVFEDGGWALQAASVLETSASSPR